MPDLDLLDKKIMYELDLNSRAPVTEIAKKVRTSKETANFRIKRLLKEGYIKNFYTIFNTSKLGKFYYKTFVKFHNATRLKEQEIIDYLKATEACAYLGSCEGPYDMTFLIVVESSRQFKEFLTDFKGRFGNLILEKEIHTVLTVHRLNQKFLYAGPSKKHSFYQDEIINSDIDETDKKILKELSANARIPLVDLAKKINADSKVIKYRIKKLEKEGIIIAYASAPNFDKLGLQFIQINFALKSLRIIPAMIEFFDRTNKCLFALELLGKYDLTIEIHVENDRVLRQIMDEFKEKFVNEYIDYDIFSIYKEHTILWMSF
ncbi:Lrp/AsnC family transcriptional regulator [Candidatus Woesearchaeota archaeon]|nr:Lrp/AsnC family transcriptional regulator [Candidatus Woesearchaeota archaeon]MBI2130581.1 Lrp/AsnC family transcriptional regulator [Candidatus Woesearchaeota archaeon]MBI2661249.1 Lrp/AsnC family transcriptional regulator [Candidatus Woesearchaeota archaeon]